MLGVLEFIKLVCSCAIRHASASVEIPYGTQKKYCCTGSLAQIRALTWDGPLDKVNGILKYCIRLINPLEWLFLHTYDYHNLFYEFMNFRAAGIFFCYQIPCMNFF